MPVACSFRGKAGRPGFRKLQPGRLTSIPRSGQDTTGLSAICRFYTPPILFPDLHPGTGEDEGSRNRAAYETETLQIAEQGRFEFGVHGGGCR